MPATPIAVLSESFFASARTFELKHTVRVESRGQMDAEVVNVSPYEYVTAVRVFSRSPAKSLAPGAVCGVSFAVCLANALYKDQHVDTIYHAYLLVERVGIAVAWYSSGKPCLAQKTNRQDVRGENDILGTMEMWT